MEFISKYFYNAPQFIFTLAIFFSTGLILFLYHIIKTKQGVSIKSLFKFCIPFDPLRSKSFHMDAKIYVIGKFTNFFFAAPGHAILVFTALAISSGLQYSLGSSSPYEVNYFVSFMYVAIILVAAEFSYFLGHYLQHRIPFLWELHKVHHSADVLNPLVNTRMHPLGGIFFKSVVNGLISGVPAGIFIFYFGLTLPEVFLIQEISIKMLTICTLDPLRHSHFPIGFGALDRLIISPHMHQVHHSREKAHWDKNFGTNLAIFDWMFGTAYRPAEGEEIKNFGIYGYSDAALQEYNTLWGAYVAPVVNSVKVLLGSLSLQPKRSEYVYTVEGPAE
jgi:sterol desaturase/sphingolipid hydroxylase (fatty acid hydroxylase superfamily)